VDCQRRWGQWRVYFLTDDGNTAYMPAEWTDVRSKDPFVEQSRGRAIARAEDLLNLVKICSGAVKRIRPDV